jgi:hypothetical protein
VAFLDLNRISRRNATLPENDTYKNYVRYAEHCLMAAAKDRQYGSIQREMAAEWLRLADAIRPSHRSWKAEMWYSGLAALIGIKPRAQPRAH